MKIGAIHIIGIIIGLLIVGLGLGFLKGNLQYFVFVVAVVFTTLPFVISIVIEQNFEKEKNERFLEFSRDLVGSVKSGTPVAKSIINLRTRDYGPLNLHIQKLANQISLGIPLTGALRTFANDSGSKVISRAVGLISEAERSGGRIETIIESVSNSVSQIEE
ncbi:MAG: type II secretion system F family protein, partial [archaeon]